MTVQIAPCHDAELIALLEARAATHPLTTTQVSATLDQHGQAWVALREDAPVGHLLSTVVIDEAEIVSVAVLPEERGHGIGAALLQAARQAWTELGALNAYLEVREDNATAIRLYERDGWSRCGRRPTYYQDGMAAVLMRRALP